MSSTLKQSLPIVASAYGKRLGIKVMVQGHRAYTDGRSIVLPALNIEDPSMQQVCWGYLAHEAAHIRYTDFEVVMRSTSSPLRQWLFNLVEDVRIEAHLYAQYPGTRQTLQYVMDSLVAKGQFEAILITDPSTTSAIVRLSQWLLVAMRQIGLGQTGLTALVDCAQQHLAPDFSHEWIAACRQRILVIPHLPTSQDALTWCDALLAQLPEPPGDAKTQTETPSPQPPHPSIQSHSSHQQQQPELSEPQQDPSATSILSSSPYAISAQELPEDLFHAVKESLSQSDSQVRHEALYPLEEEACEGNAQCFDAQLLFVVSLQARLHHAMQAQKITRSRPSRKGKLNMKRLALHHSQPDKLHLANTTKKALNTAVHLLVDHSSSMRRHLNESGETRAQVAEHSALALACALEPLSGITTEVTYFPGIQQNHVMPILKRHQRVQARLAYFNQQAHGSTPMTSALWYASAKLLEQEVQRRIIIIISDGLPDDKESALELLAKLPKDGIEVIVVGIEHRFLRTYCTNAVFIEDKAQLPKALFELTQSALNRHP